MALVRGAVVLFLGEGDIQLFWVGKGRRRGEGLVFA